MAKIQKVYTRAFKEQAVQLAQTSGKSIAQVARELGISDTSMHQWRKELAQHGKEALRNRRRVLTTRQDPTHPVAPNTLNRDFTAPEPNKKWVGDITYIPTAQGWLYLAVILDLYSRIVWDGQCQPVVTKSWRGTHSIWLWLAAAPRPDSCITVIEGANIPHARIA